MLGLVFYQDAEHKGVMPTSTQTSIKVSVSIGAVIGMLVFGHLADRLGRRKMYGIELIIMVFATAAQAMIGMSSAISVIAIIISWRILLGIGIGGDYALSAVITAEFATTRWRGAMMGAVFAMQGLGQFVFALMSLIVTAGFRSSLESATSAADCTGDCRLAVDRMWRTIVGIGAVPAVFAMYYRITIPETPRYTFDVARDVFRAEQDTESYLSGKSLGFTDKDFRMQMVHVQENRLHVPRGSFKEFCRHFGQWKHGKVLLGTASSWFLIDIAFYGLGLNNTVILNSIGFGGQGNIYTQLHNNAIGNLILICAGAIPGYWATVALVDQIGRKKIQLIGFTMLTILFIIIGFAFYDLSPHGLLVIYAFCQFFFNFGPNATTFIYPAECFPTRYRATGHGISAAAGKIGSIVALAFAPLQQIGAPVGCSGTNCTPWLNHMMEIFALFMACGILTTCLLPETKRRSLEELCGEEVVRQRSRSRSVSGESW
jgi:PHS family inorganic phosphate transporter-like MFS transporter